MKTRSIDDLETPIPVIDLDIVKSNLQKMQSYCDSHNLSLRPHVKTHKCPELALEQVRLGAVGITCQKLGEAEVMADAGISDIFISYPLVGVGKAERLARLAKRVRMSVAADNPVAVETAAVAARTADEEINVLVEFDSGAGRTGVKTVVEALALARHVQNNERLRFGGLMTYPLSDRSGQFYAEAQSAFKAADMNIPVFSGAGSDDAWRSHLISGLTEVRHGSYVFFDRTTYLAGAADLDECAVHVLATVISRPTPDRAILDSGSKTLSNDRVPEQYGQGFGLIREYPTAVISRLYEEHALVNLDPNEPGPRVGDRVRILPNHVCVVVNLHDEIPTLRGDQVVGSLTIVARGKSR